MPSDLVVAARLLKSVLDRRVSVDVDYIVPPDTTEAIKAIPGRTDFGLVSLDTSMASSKSFDWIVSADDLVFLGVKTEPAPGHEIKAELPDGRFGYYDVLPSGDDRCYSVSDQLGIMLRVHTKLNRVEDPPT